MKLLRLSVLSLILTFSLVIATSCSKKQKNDEAAENIAPPTEAAADLSDSDASKAMGLQTVNFAYDSSALDAGSKKTLNENAKVLKDKSNLKVQIEGHTDERGGIQYNIALGERRANSAKSYLIDKGINADRLSIISYGKEKPADNGHDEAAWAKNRRANFRITEK